MNIGIIGTGNIGFTLARKLRQAGHNILLANARGPDSIQHKAAEIGATAVTVEGALSDVDVVVISIPEGNVPQLPKSLFASLPSNVPVVDTGNYFPGLRDAPIALIEHGMPESVWVSEQLGRPVIKAFNSMMAASLADKGRIEGDANRIALPVAGDDPAAKCKVIGLVNDVGFDGIDAGDLAESWRQQPGTPAYCTNLDAATLRGALSSAVKEAAPHRRDLALRRRREAEHQMSSDDVVRLYRTIFNQ